MNEKKHSRKKIIKKWREFKERKFRYTYLDLQDDDICSCGTRPFCDQDLYLQDENISIDDEWVDDLNLQRLMFDEFRIRTILLMDFQMLIIGKANFYMMKLKRPYLEPADIYDDREHLEYLRDEFILESVHTLAPDEEGLIDRN
jgi:hypothetical protein